MGIIRSCDNPECRRNFQVENEESKQRYCSDKCKRYVMNLRRRKDKEWNTISIKNSIKNALILLQNDILKEIHIKVSYSDLIKHLYNLSNRLTEGKLVNTIIDIYLKR